MSLSSATSTSKGELNKGGESRSFDENNCRLPVSYSSGISGGKCCRIIILLRTVSTVFIRTKGCRLPLLERDGEKSPSCEGGSILRSIIESEGQMKLRSPVAQRKAKILLQPGIGKNGIARPLCGRGVLRSRNRHDAADNNRSAAGGPGKPGVPSGHVSCLLQNRASESEPVRFAFGGHVIGSAHFAGPGFCAGGPEDLGQDSSCCAGDFPAQRRRARLVLNDPQLFPLRCESQNRQQEIPSASRVNPSRSQNKVLNAAVSNRLFAG